MSHRTPFILILSFFLLALTVGAAAGQGGETKQVGLVITFADGQTHTEVLTIPVSATSFDVLRAANVTALTSETQFGPAICKINTTGCPAEDCFCDAAHFWAYYHLAGTAWAGATESVGVYVPANGAVEGLAWSGMDAQFNPTTKPPVYTFDQLTGNPTLPAAGSDSATYLVLAGVLAAFAGYGLWRRVRA